MIEAIINRAVEFGAKVEPASSHEIHILMEGIGVNEIPQSYKEFLLLTGKGMKNGFLQGHSCFINEIPKLKGWAQDLLEENKSPIRIKDNQLVFWMSQGYMFAIISIDEGDDPPVYFFTEDKPEDG